MSKPGIMLYFDMIEPMRHLSDAQRGEMLLAMLEYGRDGIAPNFVGPMEIVWLCIKPRLDRDDASYNETLVQRQYATFCRKRKKFGLSRIPFEEWSRMTDEQKLRKLSPEIET